MAAVNHNCQLYSLRTAHINNSVQGCTDGAAGVQNIVDKHNSLAVQVEVYLGAMHNRIICQRRQVITIQGDIEHTYRKLYILNVLDSCSQTLSDRHTASADTHQHNILYALISFNNFMRNTYNCTAHSVGIHNDIFFNKITHFGHLF